MAVKENKNKQTVRFFASATLSILLMSAISSFNAHPAESIPAISGDTTQGVPDNHTKAVVAAANHFLMLLSDEQRAKLQFDFIPQEKAVAIGFNSNSFSGPPRNANNKRTPMPQDSSRGRRPDDAGRGKMPSAGEQYGKAVWSNFPVSFVTRPGLQLGDLSAQSREAEMQLLQVLLSPKGYQKVLDIMGSDQVLADGGTDFAAGTATYLISIYGKPSETEPWMVEFGGHHLALNIVIAGSKGVITPTLTGAQPAVYTTAGKTVRVLAGENDKAFDLLHALDDNQQKQAILNYRIGDLVMGPGKDGETIVPEGLKGNLLNQKQQAMLLDLIGEWAGIINDAYADAYLKEIKASLNETWFAWSGPVTHEAGKNGAAYYRIQGPKVFIEFSPQGMGGDFTMHVHTIFRDPTNEYGKAILKK